MYQSRWAPQAQAQAQPSTADSSTDTTETSNLIKLTVPPIIDPPAATAAVAAPAPPPPDPAPTAPAMPLQEEYSYPPGNLAPEDAFAQTGAQQDDLFDDVTPMEEESMRLRSDDDLFNDDFTPAPEPEPEPVPAVEEEQEETVVVEVAANEPMQVPVLPPTTRGPPTDAPRGRGGRGGRGRGGGGGGGGGGGRGDHKEQQARGSQAVPPSDSKLPAGSAPENAPSGPRKETVAAVRGDRQATGGVRKPKLTEEELAEKMAKIQIKNASLTAAHARAEADAASFAEREQVAKEVAEQRRKEERRDRQQMMGERERNRLRKLKAIEGREWDAGKRDEDFGKGGRFDKSGGFAGDKEDYTDGREYLYRESRGGDRGRGSRRGGKEGRQQAQAAPKQEDFPALPQTAAASTTTESKKTPAKITTEQSNASRSWAEQMESNTPS